MQAIYLLICSMFGTERWYVLSCDALQATLTEVIRLAYEGIDFK